MQEIRHAIRLLIRARGFALVSLLVLAIGIGANAAIISLVDGVLWGPLPYPDADRLVRVNGVFTRLPLRMTETGLELAYPARVPELLEARSLASFGQYAVADVNLGRDNPERLRIATVTPGFFAAMGVRPWLGRTLTDGDVANSGHVVVISFRLWARRFDGDRSIVGHSVELNGREFEISGVMPRGVDLPDAVDLWIPSTADNQIASVIAAPAFLARLAPGVSAGTAQTELLRLTRDGALTVQNSQAPTLRVMPIREALVHEMRSTLLLVAAAGLLGLLVACINTGSLVLVRLSARQTEFAIRRALGATTSRLIRQAGCETLILTAAAMVIAVPLSHWTLSACMAAMPDNLRGVTAVSVDSRIFGALACLCLCISAGFAILPTLVAPHSVNSVLRRSSTQTRDGIWRHLRAALVVSEIAGAVALLAGGATLVHTLRALAAVDMGVRSSDALVAKVTLPRARYSSSNEIRLFYDRVMNELVSVPGVLLVGATSHLPGSLTDMGPSVVMSIEGKAALTDAASPYALRVSVTPRYFAAIGMDVVAGRPFIDADRGGRDLVAVISERYATGFRMEPRNALGHRVNIGLGEERWAVIVGVVKDVRAAGPESDWQPAVYVPVSQTALNATGYLVVDGGPQPKAMIPAIRRAVQRIDPTVPLYSISTVSDVQSEYLSTRRFAMMTISAFGSVGFGLAVLGLYSVVSYSVQLRAQEIAVRIALGATTADVRRQVMGSGLRQAAAGLALGIALAIALWKLTASYMPGLGPVRAIDIFVLSSVVLFVSLIATWIPSERAASIDPWIALRN